MEKNPSSIHRVRFSDCDLFGHLNNARFIDYFLDAREDHLKEFYDFDLRDYYATGISWVVGSHEILYRRPALYNEKVRISSSLLKASVDSLLVEMIMMDEKQEHLKSIIWTTFIPINVKTGRKDNHPEAFMDFALSLENSDVDITQGIRGREAEVRTLTKA